MNIDFRMLVLAVFTAGVSSPQPAGKVVDPAVFKDPPAEFRGHEMYGYGEFNLSNLTVERIRADRRNWRVDNPPQVSRSRHSAFFVGRAILPHI